MAYNKLQTAQGYDFFECSSAMQKSIRRGDIHTATYFALELFHSGYYNYVWKRLLTVSAEDVETFITTELVALHHGFNFVNTPRKDQIKGRIFITKAVVILCRAMKSRDTDHLQNFLYDKKIGITDAAINEILMNVDEYRPIPDYAYDIHTKEGRKRGATKLQFFQEERDALIPVDPSTQFTDSILQEYINSIQ